MKPSGYFEPSLRHQQTILYLPSTGTDGTGAGIGPAWMTPVNVTVSHPTPTASYIGQHRCTRFTSTAIGNLHLGVLFANADHCCMWRGDDVTESRGGFYFVTHFKVHALPGGSTDLRFFAGLSAQTGTGVATSDTIPNNTVGLWCDTTDAYSLNLVTKGTGAATKTNLTNATTLTAGTMYEFSMLANPTQSVIVTQLVDMDDDTDGPLGTILNSQNVSATMPVNTAMMAPQVGLSNGPTHILGGDTALDIMKIYALPNLKRHPYQ